MPSRKTQKAGDIQKSNVFKYIRSIGFEIESQNFFKFSEQDKAFYNLGTNRKIVGSQNLKLQPDNHSYEVIVNADENDDENKCEEENQCVRVNEYFRENIDNNENWTFEITNDISNKTRLANQLRRFPGCKFNRNDLRDRYELLLYPNGVQSKPKSHNLVVYLEDCGPMYESEWVYTYYDIGNQTDNTVLFFLKRTIDHLYQHLKKMDTTVANLRIKNGNESIIAGPPVHLLYSDPNTNLRYFQYNSNNAYSQYKKMEINSDDALLTIQTTISASVEHIQDIYIHLLKPQKQWVDNEFLLDFEYLTADAQNIHDCVKQIILSFNKSNPENKLVESREKPEKTIIVKKIKSYLFLILYKVYQYLSNHQRIMDKIVNKTDGEDVYFKNFMSLNARHSTISLYKRIIRLLGEYFETENDPDARGFMIEVFQEMIFQPDILRKYLYKKINGSTGYKTKLDKGDVNYGDPFYSLLSYFKHFEEPSEDNNNLSKGGNKQNNNDDRDDDEEYEEDDEKEEEEGDEDKEDEEDEEDEGDDDYYNNDNDWLEKSKIDVHTDDLPINNDVVLAEIRLFPRMLHNYLIVKGFRYEKVGGILLGDLHNAFKQITTKKYPNTKRTIIKTRKITTK